LRDVTSFRARRSTARRRSGGNAGFDRDLRRRARGLTADAKQKISLGAAWFARRLGLLFDEPLTVIDPSMKWELRSKLKQVHRTWTC